MENFDEFYDYCRRFYDVRLEDAVYPFARTHEIREAVLAVMTDKNPPWPFSGDSIDRELVVDRIYAIRKTLNGSIHASPDATQSLPALPW